VPERDIAERLKIKRDAPHVIPFVVAGHPTLDELPDLLRSLSNAGAPVIEIGFPFSDPIADGPVIAQAMHNAIESGLTLDATLDRITSARQEIDAALVAMISVSIVARRGYERFAQDAAAAGLDALLIPDAPIEELQPIREAAAGAGLGLALLVSPSTPPERAALIARECTAFVYLLARAGITGDDSRAGAPADLEARTRVLRNATDAPIACGFGIKSPDDVRAVTRHADAAIVGTAFVNAINGAPSDPARAAADLQTRLSGSG